MSLKVYNTLSRQKENFIPREEGKASIYVCGVTPYDSSHIGHARPSVVWDVIRRYLEYRGYQVRLVQNFTDVDDKIIARSRREGRPAQEISRHYSEEYLRSMEALGVKPADIYCKVSDHMDAIIEVVQTLVEKGYAYQAGGDVYFHVSKFPEYGKLSGRTVEELRAGARVDIDERKDSPEDFALWKAAKPGEPAWDSPWGPGRPGWHIECSAMSLKYLGEGFDFHGGGMDLVFPHHENEIAQSEACTGSAPFVRYWLHNGLLTMKAEKMSKSLGNFVTITELVKRYPLEALRLYILSTHYRSPLEFGDERMEEARKGYERLHNALKNLDEAIGPAVCEAAPGGGTHDWAGALSDAVETVGSDFGAAMDDDFNTALGLAALFGLVRETNAAVGRVKQAGGSLAGTDLEALRKARATLVELGGILGVVNPGSEGEAEESGLAEDQLLELLIELRQDARARKDWAAADKIRNRLTQLGILLEDSPSGTRWRRAT